MLAVCPTTMAPKSSHGGSGVTNGLESSNAPALKVALDEQVAQTACKLADFVPTVAGLYHTSTVHDAPDRSEMPVQLSFTISNSSASGPVSDIVGTFVTPPSNATVNCWLTICPIARVV